VVAAVQVLAGRGLAGMVGGQMADIAGEGHEITLPVLQYIHIHKTGKLIQAALLVGAVLAGASPARRKALSDYGEALGLAFQIADDVLDVVGERSRLGKNTGGDSAPGRRLPGVFGLEESRRQARD